MRERDRENLTFGSNQVVITMALYHLENKSSTMEEDCCVFFNFCLLIGPQEILWTQAEAFGEFPDIV